MPSDKFGIPQVSNEDYIRLKGYRLETNDIVFSRVGSVDINAHVGIEQNGWLFSGRVLRVRPKYDIDSLFLHYAYLLKLSSEIFVTVLWGKLCPQ